MCSFPLINYLADLWFQPAVFDVVKLSGESAVFLPGVLNELQPLGWTQAPYDGGQEVGNYNPLSNTLQQQHDTIQLFQLPSNKCLVIINIQQSLPGLAFWLSLGSCISLSMSLIKCKSIAVWEGKAEQFDICAFIPALKHCSLPCRNLSRPGEGKTARATLNLCLQIICTLCAPRKNLLGPL